ncbi:N-formylglutamate amidohydrolase [Candidatus Falkowbacteria bacterium]|nr:N-formylglutamate amidohydrolase [Candidatus Falkowbacteria bacterium]
MKYITSQIKNNSIICAIPHSSIKIPQQFRKSFTLNNQQLSTEASLMSDLYTEALYSKLRKKCNAITSNICRLVVDVERFVDDNDEPMSKVGMGVTYTRTSDQRVLRTVSKKQKKYILDKIYYPYHKKLNSLTERALKKYEKCLIIDCHSFPNEPRCYEPDQKSPRPDICIGYDAFHVDIDFVKKITKEFRNCGYTVKHNTPFKESIVPLKYYKKDKNVKSVMIEINRKLYMNEINFKKISNFTKVQNDIAKVIFKAIS